MDTRTWLRAATLAACCLLHLASCRGSVDDAAAFVQMQPEHSPAEQRTVSESVEHTEDGPYVMTKSGPLRGLFQDGNYIFKGIPYAEVPERFAVAEMKRPWTRQMDVFQWGAACVGAHLDKMGPTESEDCLKMTIWVPPGGHKHMPVVVYFHGGQNQRGSAQDELRQGDIITRSERHPVIFVSFDYRLGIFGWIQGYNVTANLGLRDQQLALNWVREHISAFGGNPMKVTLQGQSEGAHNIIAHMVSPQSKGLFYRAILHSPPANIWSRKTNKVRTSFIAERVGCSGMLERDMLACLKQTKAKTLLGEDWDGAGLIQNVGASKWWKQVESLRQFERSSDLADDAPTFLGWHPVVDGHIIPREPRVMIREGDWNKVPVLITITKNESMGILNTESTELFQQAIEPLFKEGDYERVQEKYALSLAEHGILVKDHISLMHQIATDKMWTCDVRSLALDMANTGGKVYVGMFWHSPHYDGVNKKVNPKCEQHAACHSGDMLYALPQGRGKGIPSQPTFAKELAFAKRYNEDLLKFAYSDEPIWEQYGPADEAMTFYDMKGPFVVPHYRKEQCDILDASAGEVLPSFFKSRASGAVGLAREP